MYIDAMAYIGSVSSTYKAGALTFHERALLPVAGVLATPTAPPAAEQQYALVACGRILVTRVK